MLKGARPSAGQALGPAATPTFVGLVGTTTNNNAAAGNIGEYVVSTFASGAAVGLTTATPANVTSISLTAGDWDVAGSLGFIPNALTVGTEFQGGASATTATLGTEEATMVEDTPGAAGQRQRFALPVVRFSLAATTTVFLVAQATFTVNTLGAYGTLRARRIR